MARALGSYPICRRFKSYYRYQIRPGGQAVKTPPFHGGNTSSILVRVTKIKRTPKKVSFLLQNKIIINRESNRAGAKREKQSGGLF